MLEEKCPSLQNFFLNIPSGAAMLDNKSLTSKTSYSSSRSGAAMLGEDFPLLHPPASAAMLVENVPPSHFSPLMRIFDYDLLQIR
jgi:hypothetical protein